VALKLLKYINIVDTGQEFDQLPVRQRRRLGADMAISRQGWGVLL